MQFQWNYYLLTSINKNHPNLGENKLAACPQIHSPGCTWQPVSLVSVAWKMDWKDAPVLMTFRNNCIPNGDIYSRTIQMHPDLLLEDPDISLAESKVQGVLLLNIHAYKIQVSATTRAAQEAPHHLVWPRVFLRATSNAPRNITNPRTHLSTADRTFQAWFHVSFPPARWGSLDFNIF